MPRHATRWATASETLGVCQDGDGNRVKKTVGTTTTYYAGNYYEVTGSTATKYYYLGSQRVALKVGNALSFLYADHLGGTSLTTNNLGACSSTQFYQPYGNIRNVSSPQPCPGTPPTDFGFTGQRRDADAGLMYYGARYYDPTLGRFISADTVVPGAANPQSLNRYSYVLNNPVKYVDPSGHCSQEMPEKDQACWNTYDEISDRYGLNPEGLSDWGTQELQSLLGWLAAGIRFTSNNTVHGVGASWTVSNLRDVMSALQRTKGILGNGMAKVIGGGLAINKLRAACEAKGCIGGLGGPTGIDIYLGNGSNPYATQTAVHEMGHIVDWIARPAGSGSGFSYSQEWAGRVGWRYVINRPFANSTVEVLRDIEVGNWQHGADAFVSAYARDHNPGEDFAETFSWYVGCRTGGGFEFIGPPGPLHSAALDVGLGNVR